jgi:hypothetical protein
LGIPRQTVAHAAMSGIPNYCMTGAVHKDQRPSPGEVVALCVQHLCDRLSSEDRQGPSKRLKFLQLYRLCENIWKPSRSLRRESDHANKGNDEATKSYPLASVSRPALGPTQPPVQCFPGIQCGRVVTLTIHPQVVNE